MAEAENPELDEDELESQNAEELPDRKVMSTINPDPLNDPAMITPGEHPEPP